MAVIRQGNRPTPEKTQLAGDWVEAPVAQIQGVEGGIQDASTTGGAVRIGPGGSGGGEGGQWVSKWEEIIGGEDTSKKLYVRTVGLPTPGWAMFGNLELDSGEGRAFGGRQAQWGNYDIESTF